MNKIKQLRENKGMTQIELAAKLGYSRTMVTKWETDKLEPTKGQKIDICEALDIPIEYLTISENMASVKNKYIRDISNINRALVWGSLEDALYLFACLVLIIINNYIPIPHFVPIIASLLSIGIIGGILIPILFLRNIKNVSSDLKMKYWYIKRITSKKVLAKAITDDNIDEKFHSLLLTHKFSK